MHNQSYYRATAHPVATRAPLRGSRGALGHNRADRVRVARTADQRGPHAALRKIGNHSRKVRR